MTKTISTPRRSALISIAAGLGAAPFGALANPTVKAAADYENVRTVQLLNLHTDEHLIFEAHGELKITRTILNKFNHFTRDHYSNQKTQMDPALLSSLFELQREMEIRHGSFEIISAYRSPKTNEMLRKRGRRVAKNSMHMSGRAVDFRLAGVKLTNLRDAALDLKAGGVGFYRTSDFLHFDTGRVRHW